MLALQVGSNGTLAASAASTALLEAFQTGNVGISFGVAGFLISYVVGAAFALQELGVITSKTPLAGASSGALTATLLCAGISEQQFVRVQNGINAACRANKNCQGSLDLVVRQALLANLPPDAYKRCSNRLFLSISVGGFPPKPGVTRNVLVSNFSSNAELVEAAAASSFIPLWSGRPGGVFGSNGITTRFKGEQAYDGFFTNAQPEPGGSPGYVIAISSKTPPWATGKIKDLLPLIARAAMANLPRQMGRKSHQRLSYSAVVAAPCRRGRGGVAQEAAAERRRSSPNLAAFRQAEALNVDISPGIYNPSCIDADTWLSMLVLPADDQTNQHMLQLGRQDTLTWAKLTGLAGAAAKARRQQPVQQKQG